jgi:malonyl-CoA/methylmalonyl-CoA synthetase
MCSQLAGEVTANEDSAFFALSAAQGFNQPRLAAKDMVISCDWALSPSAPGLVIFTSGTTGPPKGVVKKLNFYTDTAEAHARWWQYRPEDVMLHVLPVHHSPGISLTFLSPLITGCRVEFGPKGPFSPAAMWDRWLRGGLTLFSGVPTMYQRMMRYYEDEIVAKRGPREAQRYAEAAQNIRSLLCGTSALPFTLQTKWIKLLGGQKRILERYGGTEFTGIFGVQKGDMNNPDVSLSSNATVETLFKISLGLINYLGFRW